MWTKYLSLATFAYNTFSSPNLGNYNPFELTFGRNLNCYSTQRQIKILGFQQISKNIMSC